MLDAEDRHALAQMAVVVILLLVVSVVLAAAAGLAWSVFEFMGGGF